MKVLSVYFSTWKWYRKKFQCSTLNKGRNISPYFQAFASVLALVGLTHSAPVADISSHVVHHGHHGAVVAHGHHAPHHLAHPVHPVHPVAHHAPVHHAVHAPVHHAVHAPVHHAVHHAPAPYAPAPPAPYAPVHPAPYAPAPIVHKPAYAPAPVVHKPAPYVEPKGKEEPYAFQYGVSDDYSKANFNAAESSDGNVVSGSYSVALPDGRIQHVKYTADHYNGYVAEVTYEGTPVYPEAKPYAPAPAYAPVHA